MHDDDTCVNPRARNSDTLDQLINRRLSRRRLLEGSLMAGAALSLPTLSGCVAPKGSDETADPEAPSVSGRFQFQEIARGSDRTHHVPAGYDVDVLLRWGDPLFPDTPAFDPINQTAAAQSRQFGYNCDFVGFLPLAPDDGQVERGLLCVNHEYTSSLLMFPGVAGGYPNSMTAELCAVEMAAHGGSVVEIAFKDGRWQVERNSRYNRRIMADQTPMTFSGPAAGSPRLAIGSDPSGKRGTGTLNNCAGGVTPGALI